MQNPGQPSDAGANNEGRALLEVENLKAEIDHKRAQIKAEKWNRLTAASALSIALFTVISLLYQSCQYSLQKKEKVYEEFRSAMSQLDSDNPAGRAAACNSLISFIESGENDKLKRSAIKALLISFSVESDIQLLSGTSECLTQDIIDKLPISIRKEALDLSVILLRQVSKQYWMQIITDKSESNVTESKYDPRRSALASTLSKMLKGQTYEGLDLSKLNLDDIVVSNASLKKSNFNSSSLMSASFDQCNLEGSTFVGCSVESGFKACILDETNFSGILLPSSFQDCSIKNAIFSGYNFILVNLIVKPTGMRQLSQFKGSILKNVIFDNPEVPIYFDERDNIEQLLSRYALLKDVLRYRDPDNFEYGASWGIRKRTNLYSLSKKYCSYYRTSFSLPLNTLCYDKDMPQSFSEYCTNYLQVIRKQLSETKESDVIVGNESTNKMLHDINNDVDPMIM